MTLQVIVSDSAARNVRSRQARHKQQRKGSRVVNSLLAFALTFDASLLPKVPQKGRQVSAKGIQ